MSGSAKIMMRALEIKVRMARRLSKLEDNSQADFLLPEARRWLKTGMNETASAPEVKMKNIKSGMVKAAV